MPFFIQRNDITKMNVDAIVNAANTSLKQGCGVCGAIFNRAGAKKLQAECDEIGGVRTGEAVITKGYNLAAKYIIHTAGPVWDTDATDREEKLYDSYFHSLELALSYNIQSIAFPLISSGIYGCPKNTALEIAKKAIFDFLENKDMTIYLVVYDKESFVVSRRNFEDIKSYIDDNYTAKHYAKRVRQRPIHMMDEVISDDKNRTEDILTSISSAPARKIEDLLKNMDETFSQMLLRLIDEKGLTDVETYKRANVDRKLFSKIRSNKDYKPSKATVLAFAIALKLNQDVTLDLLKRAGYTLSHSNKFDLIIEYFIVNENYNIFEINEVLFEFNQMLLGK